MAILCRNTAQFIVLNALLAYIETTASAFSSSVWITLNLMLLHSLRNTHYIPGVTPLKKLCFPVELTQLFHQLFHYCFAQISQKFFDFRISFQPPESIPNNRGYPFVFKAFLILFFFFFSFLQQIQNVTIEPIFHFPLKNQSVLLFTGLCSIELGATIVALNEMSFNTESFDQQLMKDFNSSI